MHLINYLWSLTLKFQGKKEIFFQLKKSQKLKFFIF